MLDSDRKGGSFLSGDLDLPDLIIEELPDSMSFCYGEVMGGGGISWVMFLECKAFLGEKERFQICLDRIFTTGPPREEMRRYYSEKFRKDNRN